MYSVSYLCRKRDNNFAICWWAAAESTCTQKKRKEQNRETNGQNIDNEKSRLGSGQHLATSGVPLYSQMVGPGHIAAYLFVNGNISWQLICNEADRLQLLHQTQKRPILSKTMAFFTWAMQAKNASIHSPHALLTTQVFTYIIKEHHLKGKYWITSKSEPKFQVFFGKYRYP